MIKTCLQFAGVDLNQNWAQNTIFWALLFKWVAPPKWVSPIQLYTGYGAQVGRAPQVGLTRFKWVARTFL